MTIQNDASETSCGKKREAERSTNAPQSVLVLQQNGSAESKIQGIRKFGEGLIALDVLSIDEPLPPIIDDALEYLPTEITASLVLDFLKHPDVSQDLAALCIRKSIPIVASGKKFRIKGAFTPLT
jgi:thymidylate synthase